MFSFPFLIIAKRSDARIKDFKAIPHKERYCLYYFIIKNDVIQYLSANYAKISQI